MAALLCRSARWACSKFYHKKWVSVNKKDVQVLDILTRNWLAEEGRPESDLQNLLRLVDGIIKSDLWQRAAASLTSTPTTGRPSPAKK